MHMNSHRIAEQAGDKRNGITVSTGSSEMRFAWHALWLVLTADASPQHSQLCYNTLLLRLQMVKGITEEAAIEKKD